MSRIARSLQRLFAERGIPQTRLAEQLKVTRQAVSSWIRGKTEPNLDELAAIADFFDVTTDELLCRGKKTPLTGEQDRISGTEK